ncbi:hypothetical protein EH31_03675 [Erythrobacter longus]|uniref:Reductase n=1 Tax=Erythrobacter longus TaxID=1044 RepID=A0A074MIV0_ERYLO|nr:hypothetical protein [Erythrobacter longus]KEO91783.1 hypothetical protein EH31_03675 [Erythrobacter longus]
MARSVAIIGAGQIGYAAYHAFSSSGFECILFARTEPEWIGGWKGEFRPYVLGEDTAPEADIVLDTIAFDHGDVARYDPDKVGRYIAISSASVYCDDEGRTLDEGPVNGYPRFPDSIAEDQSIVSPGPETYSTRKVRMENKAREMFGERATILRPCAIYGAESRHPRELWFVKRFLDGRRRVPLIYEGQSQFQTTDAWWLGDMAVAAAEKELGGIFNVADQTAPTVTQIGQAIAQHMGTVIEIEPIEGTGPGFVGRTPWSLPLPMRVDASKAVEAIGEPATNYISQVKMAVDWLTEMNPTDWRAAFPQLAA